jgi:DNA-binding PadR family transcriptional regulator
MYRDNTLIPTEAIRLAALGSLMEGERNYADLASEIRYFVGRIVGPSLDLLGTSLELLCYEGLARTADGKPVDDKSTLQITDEGRRQFVALMTSAVRAPINDVSKLVIALKMRFLDLLPPAQRREQSEMMTEMCETELARLQDLRSANGSGNLAAWLDLEIAQLSERLAWFESLGKRF